MMQQAGQMMNEDADKNGPMMENDKMMSEGEAVDGAMDESMKKSDSMMQDDKMMEGDGMQQ